MRSSNGQQQKSMVSSSHSSANADQIHLLVQHGRTSSLEAQDRLDF